MYYYLYLYIFQTVGLLSAYPWAFPEAFASFAIPFPCLVRLTTCSEYRPTLRDDRGLNSFLIDRRCVGGGFSHSWGVSIVIWLITYVNAFW